MQSALTSAIEKLKLMSSYFPHGLALFASAQKCISFEPPRPIQDYMYKCDRRYHVASLLKLYESNKTSYTISYVSGNEAYIYRTYKGIGDKDFQNELCWSKSGVSLQKKQSKGGQSAARIGRLRDEKHKRYSEYIACKIQKYAVHTHGIILTGPSIKKQQVKKEYNRIKQTKVVPILGLITVSNREDEALWRTTQEMILEKQFRDDEELLQKILDVEDPKNLYGTKEVYENLKNYMLDTLIVHRDHPKFSKLSNVQRKCKNRSCKLEIVTSRSELGISFLNDFQGIAGRLRYI